MLQLRIRTGHDVRSQAIAGDAAALGRAPENDVVLQDVPAGCTAVGVPARIKAKLELVGEGMDLLAPDEPPPPARFDGSSQNRAR